MSKIGKKAASPAARRKKARLLPYLLIAPAMILFFLFLTVCVIEGISSLLSQIIREERSLSPLGKRLLTGTAVLLALVCTLSLQPPDFSHISPRAVQAMISGLFVNFGL